MTHSSPTQKFTNARLLAVQAVYAKQFSEESWDKITSRFLLGELGGSVIEDGIAGRETVVELEPADAKLFSKLVAEVADKSDEFDDVLRGALSEKIDYDRLEVLLKCILKVGMAEFYVNATLDTPIIINEYADMTKAFFDKSEVRIVNAVLDKYAKVVRE